MSSRQGQRESALRAALFVYIMIQAQFHPEGLSATLSQEHRNAQQKKRLRELTLIHFDRACLKNENTSLLKCHFSFTSLC